MAQPVSLSASPRQATGKGAARQARFRGRVPAVIYGHGRDTQPLELERLRVAPVAVDHGGDPAAEARLPRGALAGRLPRARRERNRLGHASVLSRKPYAASQSKSALTDWFECS